MLDKSKVQDDVSTDHVSLGKIGFVGLGHMGTAMAANLAAACYLVNVLVRRPRK